MKTRSQKPQAANAPTATRNKRSAPTSEAGEVQRPAKVSRNRERGADSKRSGASTKRKPSFLDLPREIRDTVYKINLARYVHKHRVLSHQLRNVAIQKRAHDAPSRACHHHELPPDPRRDPPNLLQVQPIRHRHYVLSGPDGGNHHKSGHATLELDLGSHRSPRR